MTDHVDTNDRRDLARRTHPLLGKFIQLWRTADGLSLEWTGEVHTIVRTNARYGDAIMVDVLSADHETVERMQLVSITDLASVAPGYHFAIFDMLEEAAVYARETMGCAAR